MKSKESLRFYLVLWICNDTQIRARGHKLIIDSEFNILRECIRTKNIVNINGFLRKKVHGNFLFLSTRHIIESLFVRQAIIKWVSVFFSNFLIKLSHKAIIPIFVRLYCFFHLKVKLIFFSIVHIMMNRLTRYDHKGVRRLYCYWTNWMPMTF